MVPRTPLSGQFPRLVHSSGRIDGFRRSLAEKPLIKIVAFSGTGVAQDTKHRHAIRKPPRREIVADAPRGDAEKLHESRSPEKVDDLVDGRKSGHDQTLYSSSLNIVKQHEPEMISGAINATIDGMALPVSKPVSRPLPPRSVPAIAERLRMTREALGLSQTQLCQRAGLATNTYNQWEHAKGRPGLDHAIALCDAIGLSLDWIYLGDPAALSYSVASKLFD